MTRSLASPRGLVLLIAVMASGCAGLVRKETAAPLLRHGHSASGSKSIESARARELYEEARAAMGANRFAEAMDLLALAREEEPESALIRGLFDELSRILNRRPGEWSPGSTPAFGGDVSASLIRKRGRFEFAMARVEDRARTGGWREAATELDEAAGLAREVLSEIARLPGGSLGDRWIEEGTMAMQRGDFNAATVCLEIALESSIGEGPAGASLRREATAARLRDCRDLVRPGPPRPRSRGPGNRAGLPSRRYRERMSAALLTVIRVRLLLGEREAALRESAFLLSIDPDSEVARILDGTLPSLPVWNPWESVDSGSRRLQQEFTDVTNLLRSARSLEVRGDFAAAADHFDRAAKNMHWFPFDIAIHPWNLDAESGAARCRRFAEDALR